MSVPRPTWPEAASLLNVSALARAAGIKQRNLARYLATGRVPEPAERKIRAALRAAGLTIYRPQPADTSIQHGTDNP